MVCISCPVRQWPDMGQHESRCDVNLCTCELYAVTHARVRTYTHTHTHTHTQKDSIISLSFSNTHTPHTVHTETQPHTPIFLHLSHKHTLRTFLSLTHTYIQMKNRYTSQVFWYTHTPPTQNILIHSLQNAHTALRTPALPCLYVSCLPVLGSLPI